MLILLASQVVFDLYARSAVSSAAVDAARSIAEAVRTADSQGLSGAPTEQAPTEQAAIEVARQRFESALGAYGSQTRFELSLTPDANAPDEVVLRVGFDLRGSRYSLVGPLVLPGLNRFTRTVRVRVEHIVCPRGRTCTIISGGSPGPTGATVPQAKGNMTGAVGGDRSQ